MADKLNDVLAEVRAAMAAEETAEAQPVSEGTQAVETVAEATEATETEAPNIPEAQNPAVDFNAIIARQDAAIEEMRRQLADKDKVVEQQSARVEETVEEALEMPTLNINIYGSEDDTARAVNDYNAKMGEYIAKKIAAETAPIKRKYEEAEAEAAIASVKSKMRSDARYANFGEMEGKIDVLVARDPDLAKMNPQKAYTTAYLIAKGLEGEKPTTRTATDIAQEAMNNPEVMRILAQKQAEDAQKAQANAPKMAGSGQIPATPSKSPKTLRDAREYALAALRKN